MLRGLMCLQSVLQSAVRVATLPRQVLLGVVEILLIERQPRFGQFQLICRGGAGTRLPGEPGDRVLIRRDLRPELVDSRHEIVQWPAGRRAVGRCVSKSRRERSIELVIGETHRLARSFLFVSRLGERRHLVCCVEQSQVNRRPL